MSRRKIFAALLIVAIGIGYLHVQRPYHANAQDQLIGQRGNSAQRYDSQNATSLPRGEKASPINAAPLGSSLVEQAPAAKLDSPGHCCLGPACPYPPGRIWASGEYLLWRTNGSPLPPLLTTSPAGTSEPIAGALGAAGTTILLGDERVNTDVRSGGRFTLGSWLNHEQTVGIEGNFFFLGDLTSRFAASSDGTNILARPFVNADPTSPFFGTNDALFVGFPDLVRGSFQASTTSELLGTDAYIRKALCCDCCWRLDMLAGYRFLRLHEGLQIAEVEISTDRTNPLFGVPFFINEGFDATNNFHGGELGLIGEYQRDRWFIRATGKVALGATCQTVRINGVSRVDNEAQELGGLLALPSNIGQYHSTHFSVVPEVGINVGYAITPKVRVYTGYTFLYWTQVARAGDQVDLRVNTSQSPLGSGLVGRPLPAFTARDADFWAQGINFGLEIRY